MFSVLFSSVCFFCDLHSESHNTQIGNHDSYVVYYGPWNDELIQRSHGVKWVIAHPGPRFNNISKEQVQAIKVGADGRRGTKDDVKVLLYVSIGETNQITRGMRIPTLGSGPVWRNADHRLESSNLGFSPWLVDEVKFSLDDHEQVIWSEDGYPETEKGRDGLPDENGKWGSYYVRAGDSQWHSHLKRTMTQLLGLGCDGFFLDTVDTASPWGHYGWMQEEMKDLILNLRSDFPRQTLVMNRGLFLFDQWGKELRNAVDGVMFESYVSEWNWYRREGQPHPWYVSNRMVLNDTLRLHVKESSLAVLFLNYFDPHQPDGLAYRTIQARDAEGVRSLQSVSSADLQSWPTRGAINKAINARETSVSAMLLGRRWFVPISNAEQLTLNSPDRSLLGRLVVEIEPTWCSFAFPFVPRKELSELPHGILLPEMTPMKRSFRITVFDQNEQVSALLVGQLPNYKQEALELGHVDLSIIPLDGKLRFQLKNHQVSGSKNDLQLHGDALVELKVSTKDEAQQIQINRWPHEISGLENGKSLWVRVAKMSGDLQGPWSHWQSVTPKDTTPPAMPMLKKVQMINGLVSMVFEQKKCSDLAGFLLYIEQPEMGLGLPLKLPVHVREWSFPVMTGIPRIKLHLASVDVDQNISARISGEWIDFKSSPE